VLIFTICLDFLLWILKDYDTDNGILKHVVDMEELFGHMNIKVGSELCDVGTELLRFTQNGISFSLLGRIEH
jgi:hypothetical protein